MKRFLFAIVLCFYHLLASAQSPKYTLNGTLELSTGEKFPYRLVFTESGGNISGYSITYASPDDTKATLSGTLDRHNHTLAFRETEIVYSHGFHTKAFMCLIDANLEHVAGEHGKILTGAMNNAEIDKIACTTGTIVFSNQDELKKLFEGTEKMDTVITMRRKVVVETPPAPVTEIKAAAPITTDRVTANIEKTYEWHSDSVIVDVWDGGSQDGDKITLLFNNAIQLQHYLLVKEKKRLRFHLSGKGMDVITITAETEGFEPPNTASLMLYDGTIAYSVLAYNPKGQQAIIKIKRANSSQR